MIPRPAVQDRRWMGMAALCAAMLLSGFVLAVRKVVAQGAERRLLAEQSLQAQERCKSLNGRQARARCRAEHPRAGTPPRPTEGRSDRQTASR